MGRPTDERIADDPAVLFACFEKQFAQIRDYRGILEKKEVLDGKEYPEEIIHAVLFNVGLNAGDFALTDWTDNDRFGAVDASGNEEKTDGPG